MAGGLQETTVIGRFCRPGPLTGRVVKQALNLGGVKTLRQNGLANETATEKPSSGGTPIIYVAAKGEEQTAGFVGFVHYPQAIFAHRFTPITISLPHRAFSSQGLFVGFGWQRPGHVADAAALAQMVSTGRTGR